MSSIRTWIRPHMFLLLLAVGCEKTESPNVAAPPRIAANAPAGVTEFEVEAACGECKFGLAGSSCDLAVRIDGKAYFVDGTSIDAHGDAHASDGFCNAIRRAVVSGTVKGDRFVAMSFRVLPAADK